MLTKEDLSAIRKIFREELKILRMDIRNLSVREEVKEIKDITHAFQEDIRDTLALMKLQHKMIMELDERLKRLEKILFQEMS